MFFFFIVESAEQVQRIMAPFTRAPAAVASPWAGMRAGGVRAGVAALQRAVGAPEAGSRAAESNFVQARALGSAGEQGFGAAAGGRRSAAAAAAAVTGRGREFGAGTRRAGAAGLGVRGFHASGAKLAKVKDPYSVLGVSKSASAKEIKRAYLMKVRSLPWCRSSLPAAIKSLPS